MPERPFFSSTPRRIRTCNLRFRRPMLYPIELGVRVGGSGETLSGWGGGVHSIGWGMEWRGAFAILSLARCTQR
jgi:hypothetical protein